MLASLHRPKGADERLGNLQPVTRTLPPPGFPLIDTAERKNPNAAFSVMKHKPPEHLLGSCDSQTPACDQERDSDTQDRVFLSMQHGNDLSRNYQHFKAKPPWFPVQVGSDGRGKDVGGCLSWMLCAFTQGGKVGLRLCMCYEVASKSWLHRRLPSLETP